MSFLSPSTYLSQTSAACLPIFLCVTILFAAPYFVRRLVWRYLLEPIGFVPLNVVIRKLRPFLSLFIVASLCYIRIRSIIRHISSTADEDTCLLGSSNFRLNDETSNLSRSFGLETVGLLDAFTYRMYQIIDILFEYLRSKEKSFATIRTIYKTVINDLLGLATIHSIIQTWVSFQSFSWREMKASMITRSFQFCQDNISFLQSRMQDEEEKLRVSIQSSLKDSTWPRTLALPEEARDHSSILQQLTKCSIKENKKWKDGFVSGTVYVGDDDHSKLLSDVYKLYSLSNPLHPDVWPSVNQLEAEVCSMTASLVSGGNPSVCGCMSSGGTESIILAVKAHRQYFGQKRGIRHPEVISCVTAHAGLDKACELLSIRNVRVPCDSKSFQINWKLVERYITANTIMIYASAPSYPQVSMLYPNFVAVIRLPK